MLYLHLDLTDSLFNTGLRDSNKPVLWVLVRRNGAGTITESAPPTTVTVTIWTGELTVHPNTVQSSLILLMEIRGIRSVDLTHQYTPKEKETSPWRLAPNDTTTSPIGVSRPTMRASPISQRLELK